MIRKYVALVGFWSVTEACDGVVEHSTAIVYVGYVKGPKSTYLMTFHHVNESTV